MGELPGSREGGELNPVGRPQPQNEGGGVSKSVKIAHALWRGRGLVGACVAVSLLIATGYNYTARPRYEAVAQIEIWKTGSGPGAGKTDVLEATTHEWVETQLVAIAAEPTIAKVVDRYELASSPELRAGPLRSPVELIRARLLGRPAEGVGSGVEVPPAVSALRSRVRVRPLVGTGRVELAVSAYDPVFAAMAANGLAQTCVDESRSTETDRSAEATKWLEARLQAEPEPVRPSEAGNGGPELEARGRLAEARLQEASRQMLEARSEAASLKAQRDRLHALSPEELFGLPQLAESADHQTKRRDLAEAESRKSDLDQSLGPRHPDVVALATRIQRLRASLAAEMTGVVRAADAAYDAAARQESALAASVSAARDEIAELRDKFREYLALKRDADAASAAAEALAMPKEATVEVANKRAARLIEPAGVPERPVSPDRAGNLGVALVVGLGIGVFLVAAREGR